VFDEAIRRETDALKLATADTIIEAFGGLLSEPDTADLADVAAREDWVRDIVHTFSVSHYGMYDDNRAFVTPWGFSPADISVPVGLWFGERDNMVPATHGQWLAANIPTATAHFHPAEGHLSVITKYREDIANELARFSA
jgi:pimeloyl-ACP methyl ester carboxylesterase